MIARARADDPLEPPSNAIEARLQRLEQLVLDRLIDILENGVPVLKPDAKTGVVAELGRTPAPPAYLSAAIRLLKDKGAGGGAGADAEAEAASLGALLRDLPVFDDDEDDGAEDVDSADLLAETR